MGYYRTKVKKSIEKGGIDGTTKWKFEPHCRISSISGSELYIIQGDRLVYGIPALGSQHTIWSPKAFQERRTRCKPYEPPAVLWPPLPTSQASTGLRGLNETSLEIVGHNTWRQKSPKISNTLSYTSAKAFILKLGRLTPRGRSRPSISLSIALPT